MTIFVTGASGHLASVLVPRLLAAGHSVAGLTRSSAGEAAVAALGARPVRGDLADLDLVRREADAADGVVHLALFDGRELRNGNAAGAGSAGGAAVRAMGEVLAGTGRPLVSAAAVGALGSLGRPLTELDAAPGTGPAAAEDAVLGLVDRGVRASVVRLPLVTHTRPRKVGFAAALIDVARRRGVSGVVEGGENRWPACHSGDVARVFALALASGQAGRRWHAVAEPGVRFGDIAERIGWGLGVPVRSVAQEEAPQHFGVVGALAGLDLPADNAITREGLGWEPSGPQLLDELEQADFYG